MKGFTLIEVLIGVFILTIGIVGVLYIFPLGVQIGKSAQLASIAAYLGQAKIEEFSSVVYDDLLVGQTTEEYGSINDFNFYKRTIQVNCAQPGDFIEVSCNYDLQNDPSPLKKIKVTVFWKSPLGVTEQSVSLTSLTAKK